MKSAGWRALLLSLCATAALLAAGDVYLQYAGPNSTSFVGQWGDTVGASSQPYQLVILSIDPGHGADLAGLHPGDLIDIRANTMAERFWLFGQPPTGRSVTVLARRDGQEHRFTIVAQSITALRLRLLTPIWIGFVWIALFAGVIAWRRSDDPQMRTLGLLLVTYAFWECTNQHYITAIPEWSWLLVAASIVNVFGSLTVALWAACAGSFAEPRSRARNVLQWVCYALVAATIAFGLMKTLGIATLLVDPIAFGSSVNAVPFLLACLAGAACTVLAVTESQGAERQRAIWSLVPVAFLIVVGFGAESVQGVVKSYELAWSVYYVAVVFNIGIPLVLTYVALNRRLLDVGFVLNRAAVFGIVSTILIGALVLVEWIANEWLSASHTTSAIAGMVVALTLGLSMRYLHRFVERFVDRVFFRKRYEDEAALRHFAHEAGYITNRTTLLERTLSTVKASTAADASILVFNDGPTGIDENDPALVALRAWHKPVDLARFPDSALHGQFAFPMVARGELVGALICGTKQDSEVYAPDESEALQLLADGVGSALSLLSETHSQSNGSLTGAIAELREVVAELREMKP